MKHTFKLIYVSSLLFFTISFGSLVAQNDTIYFKPIHEGLQFRTLFFGFSTMAPAFSLSNNEEKFFMQNDYLFRFGAFIENKLCIGSSMMITDYINRNDVSENMYLFGGFARLYQRNGSFNFFLELAANIGNKKYTINELKETVNTKKNFMFGPGFTWIDKNIMLEFSFNVNYLIHYNLDINSLLETTVHKTYFQPTVGINFYF